MHQGVIIIDILTSHSNIEGVHRHYEYLEE